MLEIRKVIEEDVNSVEKYLLINQIVFDKKNQILMSAFENNEIIGVGAISMDDEGNAILEFINSQDVTIDYVIGKSILNMLDLQNIKTVLCYNKNLTKLVEKLKFKRDSQCKIERFKLNLEGYFNVGC